MTNDKEPAAAAVSLAPAFYSFHHQTSPRGIQGGNPSGFCDQHEDALSCKKNISTDVVKNITVWCCTNDLIRVRDAGTKFQSLEKEVGGRVQFFCRQECDSFSELALPDNQSTERVFEIRLQMHFAIDISMKFRLVLMLDSNFTMLVPAIYRRSNR